MGDGLSVCVYVGPDVQHAHDTLHPMLAQSQHDIYPVRNNPYTAFELNVICMMPVLLRWRRRRRRGKMMDGNEHTERGVSLCDCVQAAHFVHIMREVSDFETTCRAYTLRWQHLPRLDCVRCFLLVFFLPFELLRKRATRTLVSTSLAALLP